MKSLIQSLFNMFDWAEIATELYSKFNVWDTNGCYNGEIDAYQAEIILAIPQSALAPPDHEDVLEDDPMRVVGELVLLDLYEWKYTDSGQVSGRFVAHMEDYDTHALQRVQVGRIMAAISAQKNWDLPAAHVMGARFMQELEQHKDVEEIVRGAVGDYSAFLWSAQVWVVDKKDADIPEDLRQCVWYYFDAYAALVEAIKVVQELSAQTNLKWVRMLNDGLRTREELARKHFAKCPIRPKLEDMRADAEEMGAGRLYE
jgi:hypothetical protein